MCSCVREKTATFSLVLSGLLRCSLPLEGTFFSRPSTMADRLNMSLDEVISKNSKPSSSHGSRGRGRGRGGGRGAARARRGRQYHPYGGRSNKGYQVSQAFGSLLAPRTYLLIGRARRRR